MLSRREVIAASVVGGLSAFPASGAPALELEEQDADRDGQREIARAVSGVEATLRNALLSNSLSHGAAGNLRTTMQQHFRGAAKFPDFIDIGVGVFMEMYDWHVRNRQQLAITRSPDNRYWMQFMFTTLVLRPEVDPGFIGIAYDKA